MRLGHLHLSSWKTLDLSCTDFELKPIIITILAFVIQLINVHIVLLMAINFWQLVHLMHIFLTLTVKELCIEFATLIL